MNDVTHHDVKEGEKGLRLNRLRQKKLPIIQRKRRNGSPFPGYREKKKKGAPPSPERGGKKKGETREVIVLFLSRRAEKRGGVGDAFRHQRGWFLGPSERGRPERADMSD